MACALVALITCTYALDQDSSKVYPNVRRGQRSPRLPSSGSIKRKTISEWLPQGDDMDRQIMSLYAPSLVNLALPSIPGALDTFWVGRFGDAISLAGQGVANQVFNSLFNILIFVPKVTAPLVARAFAAGDVEGVHDRTCNSLFVACALGALGMIALVGWPHHVLRTVLPEGALAAPFAGRYLRLRSLSAVAAAFSAVAFAAFRGTLNAVTPLRVAFCQNVLDMVLDVWYRTRCCGYGSCDSCRRDVLCMHVLRLATAPAAGVVEGHPNAAQLEDGIFADERCG